MPDKEKPSSRFIAKPGDLQIIQSTKDMRVPFNFSESPKKPAKS